MGAEEEEEYGGPTSKEDSILDKKHLRIFGHPLTTTQQMWIGFLVPSIISTVIFITNTALDITVACLLFREDHPFLAGTTIALTYAPSLVCLILTYTQLPKCEKIGDLLTWITIQYFQSLLFPLGIMYRFATKLFWSIVALTEEDPAREKALQTVAASHPTELFFFLDSFLNAAPQAILQAYILLSPQIVTTNETGWTLAISIITSVITLSKTAALYQRFESQKMVGRQPQWAWQQNEAHTKALINITKFDPKLLMKLQNPSHSKKPVSLIISPPHEESQSNNTDQPGRSADQIGESRDDHLTTEEQQEDINEAQGTTSVPKPIQRSLENEKESERLVPSQGVGENCATEVDDGTGTEKEPKEHDTLLPPAADQSTTQNNDPQTSSAYLTPIRVEGVTLDDRCFWPRIQTPPSSPTADPHMRPRLSINTIRTQNRPAFTSNVALPERKPRTKGLHEDEPFGIFAAFNAWLMYLIARVLVIAAFSHFYLWPSLGMITSHYLIMVAYIWFCNPCPSFWAPLIALIFILCPIEVKVQYKYPRVFLILFFALVLLEDLATVILWYCGAEWESWWYDFAFVFIIGCHGMAILNAALYLFMFKPKAKYVESKFAF